MALIEVGRVCIKKYGRDAGSKAVVTKVIGNGMVEIVTSVRPKERKSNVKHLEFLGEKVDPKDESQLYRALEIEKPKPKAEAKQAKPKK
ncbi:MAG: 50S ribosomal protein L14e [Candidatus Micrarchaeota archaeon]|nr:50S ribosomal protein L14e [Candidatus Micrarchaeota archaeon]MDE1804717.1 50S ribosomal protein L14e [Candidatus Micrarchaeota archaeon]MDE1847127.1 50S ribosomal protein L14e [Candidatus Micrarchaeota archaeon]